MGLPSFQTAFASVANGNSFSNIFINHDNRVIDCHEKNGLNLDLLATHGLLSPPASPAGGHHEDARAFAGGQEQKSSGKVLSIELPF